MKFWSSWVSQAVQAASLGDVGDKAFPSTRRSTLHHEVVKHSHTDVQRGNELSLFGDTQNSAWGAQLDELGVGVWADYHQRCSNLSDSETRLGTFTLQGVSCFPGSMDCEFLRVLHKFSSVLPSHWYQPCLEWRTLPSSVAMHTGKEKLLWSHWGVKRSNCLLHLW